MSTFTQRPKDLRVHMTALVWLWFNSVFVRLEVSVCYGVAVLYHDASRFRSSIFRYFFRASDSSLMVWFVLTFFAFQISLYPECM